VILKFFGIMNKRQKEALTPSQSPTADEVGNISPRGRGWRQKEEKHFETKKTDKTE